MKKTSQDVRLVFWPLLFLGLTNFSAAGQSTPPLPNILWITCEDVNAFLGSYGDSLAITPHVDQLAQAGVRYTHAYATAPVCSPARSALITGIYATAMGTQHLRSEVQLPDHIKTLPHYLRQAGYYCSNNDKEDYNFEDSTLWDESSKSAHWRNRPIGKPFFSVFNIGTTHQSQIFGSDEAFYEKYGHLLSNAERHDPKKMKLPPYFFDTPITRKMWARYYDLVTLMDRQVGDILRQLEEDGLEENTIIFFFSDHGTGMPRSKRALYDSGLKVPLIIKAAGGYRELLHLKPNATEDRLISFVDFAPTVLSIINRPVPDAMQGIPFLGKQTSAAPDYVYATSDRVDEAFEVARSVRNERYSYVRNYYPHLPLIQPNYYTDQSEVMMALYEALAEGNLTVAQRSMWHPHRSVEELYDRQADLHEVKNLANDPAYREVLQRMRQAQQQWALRTHDSGMIPEPMMHRLASGSTVYEMVRDENVFPLPEVLNTAHLMLQGGKALSQLTARLDHQNPIVRYWAVIGLQVLGEKAVVSTEKLTELLDDPYLSVRIPAAEALCASGDCEQSLPVLLSIAEQPGAAGLMASRALENLAGTAFPAKAGIRKLQKNTCELADGKWYGYDLYACWALTEALKKLDD